MRRVLLSCLCVISLTGCSELRVIGAAAMRELQCEAISVEWKAYHEAPEEVEPPLPGEKPVLMAKAERPFSPFRNAPGSGTPRKGLWEAH